MPYVRTRGRWIRVKEIPGEYFELELGCLENRIIICDYAEMNPMEIMSCSVLAYRLRLDEHQIIKYGTGTILGNNGELLLFLV